MSRTAAEIAKDITETREWLRSFGFINVAGKTLDELAELEANRMKVERRLHALERERAAYVRGATPSEADSPSRSKSMSDWANEKADRIMDACWDRDTNIQSCLAEALRQIRAEALEEAARECERMEKVFAHQQVITNRCAAAIRALILTKE